MHCNGSEKVRLITWEFLYLYQHVYTTFTPRKQQYQTPRIRSDTLHEVGDEVQTDAVHSEEQLQLEAFYSPTPPIISISPLPTNFFLYL